MNSASLFLTIEKPGEEVILKIMELLGKVNMQTIRTFDLRGARLTNPECPCPNHGTSACDCQISVLLIYHKGHPPASLLIHSLQETTWLYLVDTPEQPLNKTVDLLIRETLVANPSISMGMSDP